MFTLYKASAGSGKTFRLVVEYLALCLPQSEKFSHVLAITFTNNATAEMKSRIVSALSQLAFEAQITPHVSVYNTYKEIAAKIAPHLPENKQLSYIKNQSKILLQKILYEYHHFSISTIDAFFQRILRAFALEFGLNTQYNLEIDTDDFFKETVSVLLQRISKKDEMLTHRVLDLVENMMLEKGQWKIEQEITKLLELSMKEEMYLPLKQLQESDNHNFEYAKKINAQEKRRLKAQMKNFTSSKDKKTETYKMLEEQYNEQKFFGNNLFQLALLFDLKMIMDEIKAQDSRFFISETNATIHEKLGNDDVPFIYEKIGNQFSYFFIDEFQDTSKLQWQNMIPLIKNAVSGNNRFNEQGKLLLFGDVKQAIYRFRNGDADILQQLSKIEGYKDQVLPYAKPDEDYRVELLDTNYRSSKEVVEFNNAFFDFLTAEGGYLSEAKDFYKDVIQKCRGVACNASTMRNARTGRVTVRFQEEEDERKYEDYMQEQVLETVLDALQRGYACKDIAVLFSSNDRAREVAATLIDHNLPVVSADSLKLCASPEINVVIATLQYLVSDEDKPAKLSIIHYLAQQHHLNLEDYIESVHTEDSFQHFLTSIHICICRKTLKSQSLFTLLNEMIRIFSFSVHNPFLMRLLDEAEAFVSKHTGTIPFFLDWWEEEGHKKTLSTPPGIDAITISTIHKAKGLEYPVVILPFSRFSYTLTKPNIFVQDQVTGLEYDWVSLKREETPARYQSVYEEESKKTRIDQLNKLYVAHTRASEELHIITEKKKPKGAGNYSRFLAEFCERCEVCGLRYEVCGDEGEKEKGRKGEKEKEESRKQKAESRSAFVPSCFRAFVPFSPHTSYLTPHTIQQLRGIYIHNFLSSLTVFPKTEKEIEEVIKRVEETYREDITNVFHKILNDKQLQPYFAPEVKVLNETSILFPNGNLLRPDRIVFLQGRVVVIDYKTGEPTAAHKEQIDQYCEAICEMGYENVEGRVLYFS
jgi:ATP-dependent exoDNAse (exonuclease V) beta subunit